MPRILVALLAAFTLIGSAHAGDAKKPNIIYILADDLGYGELGCYGQKKIKTPNLDKMAAQGLRFTQHYAGNAVCAPSRCVLMTGKHSGHAQIRNNTETKPDGQQPIAANTVTIARLLKSIGYVTGMIGKWGLGMHDSTGDPQKQGFDHFGYYCQRHAHNHYPTFLWRNAQKVSLEGNPGKATGKQHSHDLFEKEALDFIRKNKDKPASAQSAAKPSKPRPVPARCSIWRRVSMYGSARVSNGGNSNRPQVRKRRKYSTFSAKMLQSLLS